jgi:muramoyltetrapeptide carboxypeptidase LdcA involved in peptidoglycan recycling
MSPPPPPEVGEEPYRIDRYLTQVHLAGYLKVISGFVFGRCALDFPSSS